MQRLQSQHLKYVRRIRHLLDEYAGTAHDGPAAASAVHLYLSGARDGGCEQAWLLELAVAARRCDGADQARRAPTTASLCAATAAQLAQAGLAIEHAIEAAAAPSAAAAASERSGALDDHPAIAHASMPPPSARLVPLNVPGCSPHAIADVRAGLADDARAGATVAERAASAASGLVGAIAAARLAPSVVQVTLAPSAVDGHWQLRLRAGVRRRDAVGVDAPEATAAAAPEAAAASSDGRAEASPSARAPPPRPRGQRHQKGGACGLEQLGHGWSRADRQALLCPALAASLEEALRGAV